MGLDPMKISMIRQAVEKGLAHPDEIQLSGDAIPENLSPFRLPDTKSLTFADNIPFFLRKPFIFAASRLLKSYPQLIEGNCIGRQMCGKLSGRRHPYQEWKSRIQTTRLHLLLLLSGDVSRESHIRPESIVK